MGLDKLDDDIFSFCLIITIFLILMALLGIVLCTMSSYYELQTFNRIHKTNYAFSEWFWGKTVILDYHEGKVSNVNVKFEDSGGR